jgi:hypothetical protein
MCHEIQIPLATKNESELKNTGGLFNIHRSVCIIIYSYSTSNKMHMLSQIIYSCKTLYMFRTVLSIIRSSKLRIQQQYTSNSCCCLLLIPESSR